ncbi:MAG TPA: hypothetical protein VF676_02190 [Flavobacterium sp.]|jgi:hypothetical protein
MPTNWKDIAKNAAEATNEELSGEISSLTRLSGSDIQELLDNGISKTDLAEVFRIVNDATKSNEAKAKAIRNISQGVDILVAISKKLLLG